MPTRGSRARSATSGSGRRSRSRSACSRSLRIGWSPPPGRAAGRCSPLLGPAVLVGAHRGRLRGRAAAHPARGPRAHRLRRDLPRPLARVHRARARPRVERPSGPAHAGARGAARERAGRGAAARQAARSARGRARRSGHRGASTRAADSQQLIDADGQAEPRLPAPRPRGRPNHPRRPHRSRSSCTTPRSSTSASSSARSDPPPGSPSRTRRCGPRRSPSSTSYAPRARASSRPVTPSGAGSSATSTTARSSGCWRSPTTCGWRGPAPRPTRTKRSSRCSTRPAARPPARWTSCASSPTASTRRS